VRPLPVFIELRFFHRSKRTDFLDYLENDKDVIFRFPHDVLHERLMVGSAELIFDGLDEIFELTARDTATRIIARYAEIYPKARILVTSRLIGYHGHILRDAGFAHWLLADFDEKKIAAFLDHWTADAVREPADRPIVRQRMENALRSDVIRELAGNPLLLTLMAVLARKSELPRDLSSLYDEAADLLLKQWDTHRMLASDVTLGRVIIDHKDKHDLLRDLAWQMQTGQYGLRGNLISKEKVDAAMETAFAYRIPDNGMRRKAINLLIEKLGERNYILCHVGGAQFAFVHRGFLEFFASEYLIYMVSKTPQTAVDAIAKIYHQHAWEDAWRQVLILAATRFTSAVADQILLPLAQGADAQAVATAACYAESHPFILVVDALAAARAFQDKNDIRLHPCELGKLDQRSGAVH
jgi:predicted NACHT family NTPase